MVQIRKEVGAFGSDLFFVRHANGTLRVWENQAFHEVKAEYTDKIENIFELHGAIDIDDRSEWKDLGYNYPGNKEYIKGFLIPSPYPMDHVTPMKAVKSNIKKAIMERMR